MSLREDWEHLIAALRGRVGQEQVEISRAGMTLIEIMIVVTLMAAIMALVGVNVMGSRESANEDMARTQMGTFKQGVEMYRVQYKKIPDKLEDLTNTPNGIPVLNEIPADPWGNPYVFEKNGNKIKVFSYGKDGISNTEDDIVQEVM